MEVQNLWRALDYARAPQLAAAVFALNRHLWTNHAEVNIDYRWEPDPAGATATTVAALWRAGQVLHLTNPGGISLHLGAHLCEIGLEVRWRRFLTDGLIGAAARTVATRVARLFGTACAVYLPDSQLPASGAQDFVYRGESFDAMLAWLREHSVEGALGHLPLAISDGDDSWTANCYYMEYLGTE